MKWTYIGRVKNISKEEEEKKEEEEEAEEEKEEEEEEECSPKGAASTNTALLSSFKMLSAFLHTSLLLARVWTEQRGGKGS